MWKLAFGLWTGIGVLTAFLAFNKNASDALKADVFRPALFGLYSVVFFYHVWWQLLLTIADYQDKDWKHYYLDWMEHKLGGNCSAPANADRPKKRTWRVWWSHVFRTLQNGWFWGQVVIAFVFLTFSYNVIVNAANPKNPPAVQGSLSDVQQAGELIRKVGTIERARQAIQDYEAVVSGKSE